MNATIRSEQIEETEEVDTNLAAVQAAWTAATGD